MAYSTVTTDTARMDVRDSVFMSVLEFLKEQLDSDKSQSESTLQGIVNDWFDYWDQMPPGAMRLRIDNYGLTSSDASTLLGLLNTMKDKLDQSEKPETYKACDDLIALLKPLA